jgi:8-oxo-dGTP pyrophosphatase MutT (NUDIX family)
MQQIFYQAAGGVVIRDRKILVLERPERAELRLPKGHIEQGESDVEAALREVREESGYAELSVVSDLGTQQVRFLHPDQEREVVRAEHYFLMRLRADAQIQWEAQELQFRPVWMPIEEAMVQLSFESEREYVRRALRWIEENEPLRF